MTLAADLQDPPELLPELARGWRDGAQVVLAARRKREDPFLSRLLASVFNRLFRLLVFPQFPKGGFDLVLLDRAVVDTILGMPEKNSYLFGQVLWVGFRRTTLLYDRAARQSGRSAWTLWRKVKYFIDAFTAFSYLPMRAASLLGLLLAGLGFVYAALVVVLIANFEKLGLSNALMIGGAELDVNFKRAATNIPNIDVLPIQGINVYDILRRGTLVLSKAAVEALEERFK